MSEDYTPEVIFQGSKCYWRTRNNVDVMLVQHSGLDVLELVTYEPSIDREAPRIYFDSKVLCGKIDQDEVATKLAAAKEPILRRKEVPDTVKLTKDITNSAISSYVLNRLFVGEISAEKKNFKMEIQFNFRDHDDAHTTGIDISQVTCTRPSELRPFKSPHFHTLLEGSAEATLGSLHDDGVRLKDLRRRAGAYEDTVDMLLTTRDRWRIPIVYVKVKTGKALTRADTKIWNALTRGLKPEEAKSMVAAAIDVPLTTAEAEEIAAANAAATIARKSAGPIAFGVRVKDGKEVSARPKTATTPKSRRGSVGGTTRVTRASIVGNGLTAGLNAMTSSMKRRLGLRGAEVSGDDSTSDGAGTSVESSATRPARPRTAKALSPKADAEFVNPRGTNISITPKPRSYFVPSRPKTPTAGLRSPTAKEGQKEGLTPQNAGNSQSAPSLRDKARDDTLVLHRTATAGPLVGPPVPLTASGKFAAVGAGLSARFVAGIEAITNSLKDSFSFKRTPGSAGLVGEDMPAELPNGDDDEFNATPVAVLNEKPGAEAGTLKAKPSPKAKGVRFNQEDETVTSPVAAKASPPKSSPLSRVGPSASYSKYSPINSPAAADGAAAVVVQGEAEGGGVSRQDDQEECGVHRAVVSTAEWLCAVPHRPADLRRRE